MSKQNTTHPKRIFVVGCPRSGTTLVQSVLAAHTSVVTFKESHFFSWGYWYIPLLGFFPRMTLGKVFRKFLKENGLATPDQAVGLAAELKRKKAAEKAEWFVQFLDRVAQDKGKSVWLEKTPAHVWFIPLLQRIAPDAYFVHVIRPAVPTISAWHVMAKKKKHFYPRILLFLYWHLSLNRSKRYVHKKNHYHIFYDDLIGSPESEVRKLLDAVDLEYEPGLMERRSAIGNTLISEQEAKLQIKKNIFQPIGNMHSSSSARKSLLVGLLARIDNSFNSLRKKALRKNVPLSSVLTR